MQSASRGVILSYHRISRPGPDPWGLRVTPQSFAAQMEAIASVAEPISLAELASGEAGTPERPSAVVTFDDGYLDNLLEAIPVLEKYKVPATVFVASGYIGHQNFWWDILEHVFLTPGTLPDQLTLKHIGDTFTLELGKARHYTREQYKNDCIHFKWRGEPGTRVRLYFDVHDYLSRFPLEQRRELSQMILVWAGGAEHAADEIQTTRPMTAKELEKIQASEMVSIGGHTVNHPILASLHAEHQAAEIVANKAYLEALLGTVVNTFAYPHGSFTEPALSTLKANGFVAACSTREQAVTTTSDAYCLPRLTVKNWQADELRQRILGAMQHAAR